MLWREPRMPAQEIILRKSISQFTEDMLHGNPGPFEYRFSEHHIWSLFYVVLPVHGHLYVSSSAITDD